MTSNQQSSGPFVHDLSSNNIEHMSSTYVPCFIYILSSHGRHQNLAYIYISSSFLLQVTSASLLVTRAFLVVTRSYERSCWNQYERPFSTRPCPTAVQRRHWSLLQLRRFRGLVLARKALPCDRPSVSSETTRQVCRPSGRVGACLGRKLSSD